MYYRLLWYLLWALVGLGISSGTLAAQEDARVVYPVKKDHLWGFMTKRGERDTLVIPPRYDAIGQKLLFEVKSERDENEASDGGSYRMVELNGKLGVIDDNLGEVLPCVNDYILPVSNSQFLVKHAAGFTVLDSTGKNLPNQYYSQLEFAGSTDDGTYYYTIFDQGKRGLINARGDSLLPCRYAEIQPLKWETAPFLTRLGENDIAWNLVGRGGRVLLEEVIDVKAPHPGLLLVTERENYSKLYKAYDRKGKPVPVLGNRAFTAGEYLSPNLVNLREFILSEDKEVHRLYQVKEQDILVPQYFDFRGLDGQYCTASANRTDPVNSRTYKLETLISPEGEVVDTNSWYLRIDVWQGSPTFYRARSRNGWGIIDRRGREIVPTEYQSIGPLEDGLAMVTWQDSVGIIDAEGSVVVPAEYSKISRQGNKLMAIKGGNLHILNLDEGGQVGNVREIQGAHLITVASVNRYRIANRLNFDDIHKTEDAKDATSCDQSLSTFAGNQVIQDQEPDWTRFDTWFIRDSNHVGRVLLDTTTAAAKVLGIDTVFLSKHSPPTLGPRYFTRFYTKASTEPDESLQRLVFGRDICVRPQHLFADGFGKFVKQEVLGFRIFDFKKGWEVAPALGNNGRFFMLGSNAEPLRNTNDSIIEFTFVGTAKHGLMRVCVGGKLVHMPREIDPLDTIPKELLSSLSGLLSPFYLALSCGTLSESVRPLMVQHLPGDTARWGVLDSLGQWAIPPIYDHLEENVAGQMIARQGVHYGVINGEGDTIVPFLYRKIISYKGFWRVNSRKLGEVYFNWRGHQIADVDSDSLSFFREGFAARLIDGRWSYIDQLGRQLQGDSSYLQARPFGEGLAAVQPDSTYWSFLDTSGQLHGRFPIESFQDLGYFSSGRCRFRRGRREFGYLNKELEEISLPFPFRRASNFDRGRAIVEVGSRLGVIDTIGNFVLELGRYKMLTPWNEAGVAVATLNDGKKYLVDLEGEPLHQEPFDDIDLKGEGPLYPVRQDRLWGYLNEQGEQIVPCIYDRAEPFADKHARVQKPRSGYRWTFIDTIGRAIHRRPYSWAEDFSGGLARVRNNQHGPVRLLQHNGKERNVRNCDDVLFVDGPLIGCTQQEDGGRAFFADHDGNQVFLHTYEDIEEFGDGEMTFVKASGRWGIIDRRGMQLVACKYYFIDDSRPDGIFKVGPPAFGIYDRCGKLIVPVEFDNLELMEKGLFRVERGEQVGYLDIDGEKVWTLKN